jgi:hypothetical protein
VIDDDDDESIFSILFSMVQYFDADLMIHFIVVVEVPVMHAAAQIVDILGCEYLLIYTSRWTFFQITNTHKPCTVDVKIKRNKEIHFDMFASLAISKE